MNDSMMVYHTRDKYADTSMPDPEQDTFSKTVLGFWLYLLTDCLLFATLFATYAVMHHETFGGPGSRELFSLPIAFSETMLLLLSSVTCGLAVLSAVRNENKKIILWLIVTFFLGASFIATELTEFSDLIREGHGWDKSAFLSSFFTLVGTHGLHVTIGLFWMCVMIAQISIKGVTVPTFRRLVVFSLFWHFLDLVWIFIFTFVYLMGVI